MKRIKSRLLPLITLAILSCGGLITPLTVHAQEPPTAVQQALVNINTATVSELSTLKGIGPIKAEAIVRFREEHGSFSSIDDIMAVRGIGEKTVAKNRTLVSVE